MPREQEDDIIISMIWMKIFSTDPSFKNIEITKYEPSFNGAFSSDNLLRVKEGAYVINLGDKQSNGKHWISLFIDVILLTRYSEYSLVIPLYGNFMVLFL